MRIFILCILFFTSNVAVGQLSETLLPIVLIDTESNLEIIDEPKTNAFIKIIYNGEGQLNSIQDDQLHFSGNIGIEIRGESSQTFPKKSYLFETRNRYGGDIDASFLNFPSEEDFILYAPYSDKTLLNNVLAMDLARRMGHYASKTQHVELVLNGEYQGVYVLMEKIKRDVNRVDVAVLEEKDERGDGLTGGYIFRIDKGDNQGWNSKYEKFRVAEPLIFQYVYPDQFEITAEQQRYIRSYMDAFEDAVASEDYRNPAGQRYSDFIDLRSFIDNFIINELSRNVDAFRLSSYFHKKSNNQGGKLNAGPVWDYNLSFGNANYCRGEYTDGWLYYDCIAGSPIWWDRMLQDNFFVNGLKCRWVELRKDILSDERLEQWISERSQELADPAQRNFERWPVLGKYVWPNPEAFVQAQNYEEVIQVLQDFLEERLAWLDDHIPGDEINCGSYEELSLSSMIAVEENGVNPELYAYPNPASDVIEIRADGYISKVQLQDMLGNVMEEKEVRYLEYTYHISSHLPAGTYILSAIIDNQVVNEKVIIQR